MEDFADSAVRRERVKDARMMQRAIAMTPAPPALLVELMPLVRLVLLLRLSRWARMSTRGGLPWSPLTGC
jgi:hypothetical protein